MAAADKSRGFTCQGSAGVWEGSAETRGLFFCHRLFLVCCGTWGDARQRQRYTVFCRKAGGRVPNMDVQ